MKSLVVFYSRTGNTRYVGNEIAKLLDADVEEVQDSKNRKGALGYLSAGIDGMMKKATDIKFEKHPSEYELVVIGTPIWGWNLCPAIRTYLGINKLKKAAFFCTEGGSGGPKAFADMEKLSSKPIATLEITEKKLKESSEEIKEFCDKLK